MENENLTRERIYGTKHTILTNDLLDEEWVSVFEYEGLYEVSNFGRVKALPKKRGAILAKAYLLSQKLTKKGYLTITLQANKLAKYPPVHRLVAKAFIPNPHNYPQVNHKDGNKTNNQVNNLEWCSALYNQLHAIHTGLKPSLPACNRKFTDDQIIEIRANSGLISHEKMGKIYGVSQGTITKIIRRERYII